MSYQLKLLPNEIWRAQSKATRYARSVDNGAWKESDLVDVLVGESLDECADFLIERGVDPVEIEEAIVCMQKNEHNVAEFGIYGKLVFTRYEGVVH